MDGYGFATIVIGFGLYYLTKKKYPILLVLGGIGIGIVIGAVWAYLFVMKTLG